MPAILNQDHFPSELWEISKLSNHIEECCEGVVTKYYDEWLLSTNVFVKICTCLGCKIQNVVKSFKLRTLEVCFNPVFYHNLGPLVYIEMSSKLVKKGLDFVVSTEEKSQKIQKGKIKKTKRDQRTRNSPYKSKSKKSKLMLYILLNLHCFKEVTE